MHACVHARKQQQVLMGVGKFNKIDVGNAMMLKA